MRWVPLALASMIALHMSAQGAQRYERAMTGIEGYEGWVDLYGRWDEKGQPYILSIIYANRWDAHLMSRDLRAPNRLELKAKSGKVWNRGIAVETASSGGGKSWSAYVGYEPFESYRVLGNGLGEMQGRVDGISPVPPRLMITEEGEGKFRWDVQNGVHVLVDVSTNDGETWDALGDKSQGTADIKDRLPRWPVVRVQAFQGLHAYVDFYIPGQGLVKDGWPYRQQTCFQATWYGQGCFSNHPALDFTPSIEVLPANYLARIKFHMDYRRLPFKPQDLFPKKFIQKVFQAEWLGDYNRKHEKIFGIGEKFLKDSKRVKGLRLARVFLDAQGGWKVEELVPLGPDQPLNPGNQIYGYHFKNDDLVATFKDYFVIYADH